MKPHQIKKDLDTIRKSRRKTFEVKIEPDRNWSKEHETERMHVLSMTGNGFQWSNLGFYKDELDQVIKLLKEYRAKL